MIKSCYVHIPFCKTICSYCDFCKNYHNKKIVKKYLLALEKEVKENYKNDIIVDGVDNIKVSVAKCCNPVPGDEIIGYITKGEGIIVHKKSCPNIKNIDTRLIDVDWNSSNSDKLFIARLRVMTDTTNNHILDIVTKASTRGITISSINEINDKNGLAYEITVKVKNKDDLLLLVDDLRILPFVKEVIR